jgi:hypothetical protein
MILNINYVKLILNHQNEIKMKSPKLKDDNLRIRMQKKLKK